MYDSFILNQSITGLRSEVQICRGALYLMASANMSRGPGQTTCEELALLNAALFFIWVYLFRHELFWYAYSRTKVKNTEAGVQSKPFASNLHFWMQPCFPTKYTYFAINYSDVHIHGPRSKRQANMRRYFSIKRLIRYNSKTNKPLVYSNQGCLWMNYSVVTVMATEKAWKRKNLYWPYMGMVLFVLLCAVSAD